ncbi:hypothetical protein HNR60_001602 [Rhodopseudomonas rhenobacensis]|uniref:Uncharacterized protein n=1 Tax=Rhodopseudomonas rhenobacensis TaxID=87461 RepID=A0A7W7Z2J8_9BRAD|nr:hypothetical protein [Rhodopseudomonas rhenobacensis]MBB5046853.1 hypothetical protein [Rhodopseudomonas rhenobacensis]
MTMKSIPAIPRATDRAVHHVTEPLVLSDGTVTTVDWYEIGHRIYGLTAENILIDGSETPIASLDTDLIPTAVDTQQPTLAAVVAAAIRRLRDEKPPTVLDVVAAARAGGLDVMHKILDRCMVLTVHDRAAGVCVDTIELRADGSIRNPHEWPEFARTVIEHTAAKLAQQCVA